MADFRPIMFRPEHQAGPNAQQPPARVIGVEFRVRHPAGGWVEELKLVPLEFEYPWDPYAKLYMPCTLHTSRGDVGFEIGPLP